MKTFRDILLDTFKVYFTPDREEFEEFIKISKKREVPAKTILKTQAEVFDQLWFVTEGMIRSYVIADNRDYTSGFYTTGFFLMDPTSFSRLDTSQFNYEALFPTTYHYWEYEDYMAFLERYPHHRNGRRLFIQAKYLHLVGRLVDFQTSNLKDRYLKMIELHGDLINIVPQYHLASFMGVKPQSLSRIKTEITNGRRNLSMNGENIKEQ